MPFPPEQIAALIGTADLSRIPAWEELPREAVRRVSEVRKTFSPQIAPIVLELSELRHRAKLKFQHAELMIFDREALEQASGERIASWRAQAYSGHGTVADLTCGIAGDTLSLADVARVLASDINPARARMAEENARVCGLNENVKFRVGAAAEFPHASAYFLDPSRRVQGKRSRHLAGLSPALDLLSEIFKVSRDVGVKLSPATPDEELALLGGNLEFISDGGVCKEVVVWFGELRAAQRSATVLPAGAVMVRGSGVPEPAVSSPLAFLLEPDPAVVRAGLIRELCQGIGAAVMDPQVAYLTSGAAVQTPFASCYHILASLPFSLKSVKGALRELGIGHIDVKKRAFAPDVDTMRKALHSDLPGRGVVVLARIGSKPWAFICRRQEAG